MLTFNNTYSINRGRAQNSNSSGYTAPDRLGDFFIPDLIFGGVENTTPFLKEIISDIYYCLLSPRNLNGFEETSQKGIVDMNNLTIFNFNKNQVRTQLYNGQPYFCLKDVCKALSIQNNKDRTFNKGVETFYLPTKGGKQNIIFINEPNLYRLIFRSNKPQAQAFADWVYNEVLPSIRKTGSYSLSNEEFENWKEIVAKILTVRCAHLLHEEKQKLIQQITNILN